ncbi:MAG: pyrroline-5-carboxylate reductase family protein [Sphingomicrobium sp.]
MNIFPTPTWLVGCGNMTGAMVEGWRGANVDLSPLTVIRPSGTPVEGIRTVRTAVEAGVPPKLVILGFKPQQLADVAPSLAPYLSAKTIVLSLLAGADCATLRRRFPGAAAIVRAMPNLPVAIRRGVVALYSADADEGVRNLISPLISQLGFGLWATDEAKFGAVGAVAGSGPAYVARFIGVLAKDGEKRGLDPDLALTIAIETVLGTAWLNASTREDPAEIARKVASPKGTTEAALAVLDSDDGLKALIGRAIDAAASRGSQLAAEVGA